MAKITPAMALGSMKVSSTCGLLDFGDDLMVAEKYRRRQHQDGAIDEHGAIERHHRIDQVETASHPLGLLVVADMAGLYQRRVEVEIVRHYRGPQDADCQEQAVGIEPRHETAEKLGPHWFGPNHFDTETRGDDGDQRQYKRLDGADAEALKRQQKERIGAGEEHTPQQRNMEQHLQRDGRAQHLGQIAGRDGDFAQPPHSESNRARISLAAGLRQVASGDDPEARRESLQQDGHAVRHDQDPQ